MVEPLRKQVEELQIMLGKRRRNSADGDHGENKRQKQNEVTVPNRSLSFSWISPPPSDEPLVDIEMQPMPWMATPGSVSSSSLSDESFSWCESFTPDGCVRCNGCALGLVRRAQRKDVPITIASPTFAITAMYLHFLYVYSYC